MKTLGACLFVIGLVMCVSVNIGTFGYGAYQLYLGVVWTKVLWDAFVFWIVFCVVGFGSLFSGLSILNKY